MAIPNKIIRNPKSGQDIRFLRTSRETNGALLEMESTYHSHSKEPVAHYHPHQSEDFEVVDGELTVRMEGQLRRLNKGERLHVPANTIHAMWNDSDGTTVVNWKVQPALDTEYFLETAMGIAAHRKTNKEGMANLLQVALLANRFSQVFRLVKPPFAVQRVVFLLLTPVAWMAGYRAMYKEYID